MEKYILEAKHLTKSFSGHKVLDNVSLVIRPGEILCLVGENGSGKSTLIKIISGFYEANIGEITLGEKSYSRLTPSESIRQGVQVIYQDFSVFPNLTVAENISLSTQLATGKKIVNWAEIQKNAQNALDMINVKIDLDEEVGNLSVAQKQLVAIARAILQEAKLIIMDEPTTTLTQKEINRLYEVISWLSEREIAVMFVSHKLEEVFAVCNRIIVLRNGKLIVDESINTFQKEKLVYYMTGEEINPAPFEYKPQDPEPILKVNNLTLKGGFSNISFELHRGEILGIAGQLGSGRTELAKSLFGMLKVDSGEIIVKGENVHLKKIKDALRYKIAYVPEDRLTEGLLMERTVVDNINTVTLKDSGFFVDVKRMIKESLKWIKELSIIPSFIQVNASTFSGGNQQRIVIAKWLATQPEILILNGPTVGVDVKSKNEIHTIIKQLADTGIGIILISDDIGEVLSATNRVFVINLGEIIYESPTSETNFDILAGKVTQIHS